MGCGLLNARATHRCERTDVGRGRTLRRPMAQCKRSEYVLVMAVIALALVSAGIFVFEGALGLRRLHASGREDRRRSAAGLPLERYDPQPPSRKEDNGN